MNMNELNKALEYLVSIDECDAFRMINGNDIIKEMRKFLGDFDENCLYISNKFTSDMFSKCHPLSNILIDKMFPSIQDSIELYHYTYSMDEIVTSKKWRMYSLSKYLLESEYVPFYQKIGLTGTIDSVKDDNYNYRKICDQIFLTCFTDTLSNEAAMKRRFLPAGGGNRLKLTLSSRNGFRDLRKMMYSENPFKTLIDLNAQLTTKFGICFIPKTLSKLGAFYLPAKDYQIESEIRLLFRQNSDEYNNPIKIKRENENSFIEMPLENGLFKIDINIDNSIEYS